MNPRDTKPTAADNPTGEEEALEVDGTSTDQQWDAAGDMTHTVLPTGLEIELEYNDNHQLTRKTAHGAGVDPTSTATTLILESRSYDPAGRLIEQRAMGIFNIVNPGVIAPFEVMMMYKEIVDPEHEFAPLPAEDLGEVARAPRSNCILDTTRLEDHGIFLSPVRDAIDEALRSLAKRLGAERVTAPCVSV